MFNNNQIITFKIAYKLLYKNTKTNINDIPFTPTDFSNYFNSKIIDIRSKVEINMINYPTITHILIINYLLTDPNILF